MLRWFARRLRDAQTEQKGFTLIELLIVIIIIGILAAIAIPFYLAQTEKANQAACRSDTRNAAEAGNLYGADNGGNYTGLTPAELEAQGFNQTPGHVTTVPSATATGFTLSTNCADPATTDPVTFDSDDGTVSG